MDLEQRQRKAELLRGRESRRASFGEVELRDAGDGILTLEGTASVTERAYDMGWYEETIKRGAFTKTLSENPDVQLLINHTDLPLARTINGTLRLSEDAQGLRVAADLQADDPDVQRLAPKMRRGDVNEMSFAFRVTRQTWDEDYANREISEVSLDRGDVSVVAYGANPFTAASLRSMFADLADLDDDKLAELRDDPTIITIVRRLAIPAPPTISVTASGNTTTGAAGYVAVGEIRRLKAEPTELESEPAALSNLDLFRARAFALALRQK